MASKQTYECYVCKRNGFPDTRVYLDGKTDDGKTIYKNEDMSAHSHKRNVANTSTANSQQSQQLTGQPQQQQQPTLSEILMQIKLLQQKVDKILDAHMIKD
jgi:hypothetical protein